MCYSNNGNLTPWFTDICSSAANSCSDVASFLLQMGNSTQIQRSAANCLQKFPTGKLNNKKKMPTPSSSNNSHLLFFFPKRIHFQKSKSHFFPLPFPNPSRVSIYIFFPQTNRHRCSPLPTESRGASLRITKRGKCEEIWIILGKKLFASSFSLLHFDSRFLEVLPKYEPMAILEVEAWRCHPPSFS